jgi:hypothetical protein
MSAAEAYQYEYTPPKTYREILESAGGFWSEDFAQFCIRWHTVLIPSDDYGRMHGVELDLPIDPDPEELLSFKLPKPAFRAGYEQGQLCEEYRVSVVRHFSRERVNKIGSSHAGHTDLYITETGRVITFSDGCVGESEGQNSSWGDAIESVLRNQNWVSLGNASELDDMAAHLKQELKKLAPTPSAETIQTHGLTSRQTNRPPYTSWGKRTHLDRWIAGTLLLGGIWVALDLPFNLSAPHHLWDLPFVRLGVYPLGLLVIGFWILRALNIGSVRLWRMGWWISILWHAGWIAFLIVSLIGLMVMMAALPWHLAWLFVALAGSVLGLIENRWREADQELLKLRAR